MAEAVLQAAPPRFALPGIRRIQAGQFEQVWCASVFAGVAGRFPWAASPGAGGS
jgi:hypothetical protein